MRVFLIVLQVADLTASAASFSSTVMAAADFISSHSGNKFTTALRYCHHSASEWSGPPKAGALVDLAAVLSTLKDPVISSQCLYLLLEQVIIDWLWALSAGCGDCCQQCFIAFPVLHVAFPVLIVFPLLKLTRHHKHCCA
jgi:hypothetical protein